jgi:hypothetical protein
MRRFAWGLLLVFAFAIPWEYSLDLGEPVGNVARVVGVLLLLVAVPAVLQAGRWRTPGPLQWVVLAFYLWFCCSYFWTIDPLTTLDKMRGYFQEMMIVWLVWEFAESPQFCFTRCFRGPANPVCRRRTRSERRGSISRSGFSAGGGAV